MNTYYSGNNVFPLYPEITTRTQDNKKLFCEFVSEYTSKKYVTQPSRIGYLAIAKHITNYCRLYSIQEPLTDEIGAEFVEEFIYYLKRDCNLMLTTVAGFLEKLRALLNKATLYGYAIDNTFREVKITSEETYAVYLPDDEILKIYFYKNLSKKEKIVRDYFVIGCLTGMRYSDFSRLEKSNFQDNNTVIRIKTKKTGKVVHIPVDRYVIEIMQRHDWVLPKCACIQQFNKILRNICRQAGLNEEMRCERTVGLHVVTSTKQKWEMISSHTARRSFATNMHKAGFSTIEIMGITGHTSEKTFYRYIRFSNESAARSMINHPHFRRNN